jgi:hypothetical protein
MNALCGSQLPLSTASYKWDRGTCTSKRKTTCNKTKDEEINEGTSLCNSEGNSERGWKSAKDDIENEAYTLHYPEECCWDPETAGSKGVPDTVESE